jgi:hypothetical protein
MDKYWVPGGYKDMPSILLTNRALVYEPKCGGMGGGVPQPMSTAVHRNPNKLWAPYLTYGGYRYYNGG